MSPIPAVNAASSLETGTVQSVAAIKVMKMAMQSQESNAMQLLAALPQAAPQLATSGTVGTQLHAVA